MISIRLENGKFYVSNVSSDKAEEQAMEDIAQKNQLSYSDHCIEIEGGESDAEEIARLVRRRAVQLRLEGETSL